jgi:hypothetical protein
MSLLSEEPGTGKLINNHLEAAGVFIKALD